MQRGGRLILVVTTLALSTFAGMLAMAIRGTTWADVVSWRFGQRFGYVKSVAGSVTVQWNYVPNDKISDFAIAPGMHYHNSLRVEPREGWWRREWFTLHRAPPIDLEELGGPGAMTTYFILPLWLFVLPVVAVTAWHARSAWRDQRARQRRARGQCIACGYDLRASPTCCPECGDQARDGAHADT